MTEPWLTKGNNSYVSSNNFVGNPNLKVGDLIDHNSLAWKKDMVEANFNTIDIENIPSIPLLHKKDMDKLIWKFSPNGEYIVRSAYHNVMNNLLDTSHLKRESNWMNIWQLNSLPKIKHFLWRFLRGCLPTRENPRKKNVICPLEFMCCGSHIENEWHIFLACDHEKKYQSKLIYGRKLRKIGMKKESFSPFIFNLLHDSSSNLRAKIGAILWSFWKCRNTKSWDNLDTHLAVAFSTTMQHFS